MKVYKIIYRKYVNMQIHIQLVFVKKYFYTFF